MARSGFVTTKSLLGKSAVGLAVEVLLRLFLLRKEPWTSSISWANTVLWSLMRERNSALMRRAALERRLCAPPPTWRREVLEEAASIIVGSARMSKARPDAVKINPLF